MKKIFLLGSLFGAVFSSVGFAGPVHYAALGGTVMTAKKRLVFGGSFYMVTNEHESIGAHLMQRFGFENGELLVAYPYKEDEVPPEIRAQRSLRGTEIAVENFDEGLELNSIDYRDFHQTGRGQSTWKDADGKRFTLKVNDFDIRQKNIMNALGTLEELHRQAGDANDIYWVSGGDSFASVKGWVSRPGKSWQELFDHANWIVVSRPGYEKGEGQLDFSRSNPLEKIFDGEFLSQYKYSFDAENQVHVYERPGKPGIYIVDLPVLRHGATDDRESHRKDPEREVAQDGQPPSVFEECVRENWFPPSGGGEFGYFTRKNVETYARYLSLRLAGGGLDPRREEKYLVFLGDLARMVREKVAQEEKEDAEKPFLSKAGRWMASPFFRLYEEIQEKAGMLGSPGQMRREMRKLANSRGAQFAKAYMYGEAAEMTVLPGLGYVVAGKAGLVLGAVHPNEMILMPAYAGAKALQERSRRKKLGGGSYGFFKKITAYRSRLLRSDPDLTLSRWELPGELGLGIGDDPLVLHIIRSRLPKKIPLAVRRWDDRQVKWHDLNVSTNELRAMLGDGKTVAEHEAAMDGDNALLADSLLVQVLSQPLPRARFRLFLGHRTFKRLFDANIAPEVVAGFNASERAFLEKSSPLSRELMNTLQPDEYEEFSNLLADVFALSRAIQADPGMAAEREFWTVAVDLMHTRYPDAKGEPLSGASRPKTLARLQTIARLLNAVIPDAVRGMKMSYRGQDWIDIESGGVLALAATFKSTPAAIAAQRLPELTALRALREQPQWFRVQAFPSASLRRLPRLPQGEEAGNLYAETENFHSEIQHDRALLVKNSDRAERVLAERARAPRVEKIFRDAEDAVDERLRELREDLRKIQYEILLLMYPRQANPEATSEDEIAEARGRYAEIQGRMRAQIQDLRALNQMRLGIHAVNVRDFELTRAKVGELLGLSPRENRLGDPFYRQWARKAAQAGKGAYSSCSILLTRAGKKSRSAKMLTAKRK